MLPESRFDSFSDLLYNRCILKEVSDMSYAMCMNIQNRIRLNGGDAPAPWRSAPTY